MLCFCGIFVEDFDTGIDMYICICRYLNIYAYLYVQDTGMIYQIHPTIRCIHYIYFNCICTHIGKYSQFQSMCMLYMDILMSYMYDLQYMHGW